MGVNISGASAITGILTVGLFLKYGNISQHDFTALTRPRVSWRDVFSRNSSRERQKRSRPMFLNYSGGKLFNGDNTVIPL